MALPQSPAVVVLENDQSVYVPNVQSSVVGIVGFADKGPTNKATLVTSQSDLLNKFGKPSSDIPGQALEGALEILEATNQMYFVRAVGADALEASTSALLGFCPAVIVSSTTVNTNATSINYSAIDNFGTTQVTRTVSLASSIGVTTMPSILTNAFDPSVLGDQDVFALHDSGVSYLVSRYPGANARLIVSSTAPFGFSAVDVSGLPISTGAGNLVTASGGTAHVSALVVQFNSNYPGTGYNLTTLKDGSVQGLSVEIENKSIQDSVVINSEGSARERFDVVLSPSSAVSLETLLVDDPDNNSSDYANATVLSNGATFALPDNFSDKISATKLFTYDGTLTVGQPRFVKLVEGTYSFAGGDSGYSTTEGGDSTDRTSIIGTATNKSGIYALDDDSLGISIALVPGITHQQVQNALITLAESSKNFVAVVSPPYGLDNAQEAVDWMNGRSTARTAALNNSYGAVYWPWVRVFNYFAGADEWYDPSIFAVRQMVFTDAVAEPWFAPAGFRRGRLTKPSDVEVVLNQGDRDVLYINNVNPINKEVQTGITVFGQKTAQRLPTALDRVNVRRLMIFIRKTLLQLGKPFQFEPSDQFTWELVEDAIRPFLDDLLARRAIVEGDVKCDSTTNTPLRRDRNELWCAVTIKPTKAAETIVFEVNLTNQSATVNG